MERYQIVELDGSKNHAGSKATADFAAIADALGFRRVDIRMNTLKDTLPAKFQRQLGYFRDWKRAWAEIQPDSILLTQHPFHHKQLTREKTLNRLKTEKGVRFICVVHDVEEIREYLYSAYYAREFDAMLRLADALIVHNPVMRDWFIRKGVPAEKLIALEIFDYLQKGGAAKGAPAFERRVTIAGNLDTAKSAYIGQLGEVKGVGIDLYGSNYSAALDRCENIHYHGAFPADEIPAKLNAGFGLVWDGDSIDGCTGRTGEYLRYNNPHKLSLYLSSGLPVVVWEESAEARLVKALDVGLCVRGLRTLSETLNGIDAGDYRRMADNAAKIGARLCEGHFGKRALEAALKTIEASGT